MGTESAAPVNLLDRAVFVVVTMHSQASSPQVRTVFGNRSAINGNGTIMLRMDSNNTTPLAPMYTYMDRDRESWYGSWFGMFGSNAFGPPFEIPYVWAFQYRQAGADVELKHLPHSDKTQNSAPETIMIKNTTINAKYGSEWLLSRHHRGINHRCLLPSGWRNGPSPTDVGAEHGNCTLHEIVVSNAPLTDAEFVGTYKALATRWAAA